MADGNEMTDEKLKKTVSKHVLSAAKDPAGAECKPVPRVLGISGSPRKNGNSDILTAHILKGAKQELQTVETVYLRDYRFESCIGCEKCRRDKICTGQKDGMTLLYPSILRSQYLVLISPTHNYNVSALVKAFIDRLYCFYDFGKSRPRPWSSRLAGQNRRAVIGTVCEQESRESMGVTLEAMGLPLRALGYEIVDEIAVFGLFDKGIVKAKTAVLEKAVASGRALVRL
jgi:multimeric flavodoxin WrbA